MPKSYDELSLNELFIEFQNNWKALATGIKELLGDAHMPDPREVAELISEMPEEHWTGMFHNEHAREDLNKTMDLQKLMTDMQVENVAIMQAALNKTYT